MCSALLRQQVQRLRNGDKNFEFLTRGSTLTPFRQLFSFDELED
jgi:hypothetical protein